MERIERTVLIAALALLVVACFLVLRPFLSATLWAAILALTTWPLFCRLRQALGGRASIAAFVMTIGVILVLVIPLTFGGIALAQSAEPWLEGAKHWLDRGLPQPPDWVAGIPLAGQWLHEKWQGLASDGGNAIRELKPLLEPAKKWAISAGRSLGESVFTLLLSAMIVFFLWRDGEELASRVSRIAERVVGERAFQLAEIVRNTVRGTVYGILGTAMAQGALAAVGLAVAGVPGALVLGVATFFLSVVPIGPPLIWGPAAFWLYQQDRVGWAIFLFIWGAAVVSSVDNLVKPLLISRGSKLPFILVFTGVLGGVIAFGFVGIFLGPTLLAVAYRLLDEWSARAVSVAGADSPGPATGERAE
ncbi:MAG: AI-2E family transporter [Betaproteobacteria bacterium]|nr:AI-2E family transporter [Betaproteobacteria bacterium]